LQGIGLLLLLAVALGSDAFSVAACVGLNGATVRQKMRLAAGFGLFQFLMPIMGLAAGQAFGSLAGAIAAYIGGAVLVGLGGLMIWRALSVGFQCPAMVHESWLALLSASVGVSLDALAVGVGYGLGVRQADIVLASAVIGAVAFLMTFVGVEVGVQVGKRIQRRAPILGGAVLVALGILALLGR